MEITLSETQAASLVMAIDEYAAKLRHDAQQAARPAQQQLDAEIEADLGQVREALCDQLLYEISHRQYAPLVSARPLPVWLVGATALAPV